MIKKYVQHIQNSLNSDNIQTKNIDIKQYCLHKKNHNNNNTNNIICYTKDNVLHYVISINKKQVQK